LNQTPLKEAPTVFQQIFAETDQKFDKLSDDEEESSEMELPELVDLPKNSLSQTLHDIFSGPSHALPPPLVVYDAFMDKLLRKIPDEKPAENEVEKDEEVKIEEKNGKDKQVGDLAEIERQTLENIQNLSLQHHPQVMDPYEFLAKFFSTNFSISDTKIPLKITPHLEPRKNHKRKNSGEISQNNQVTELGENGKTIPTKNSEKEQSGKNTMKLRGKISRRLSEGNIKKGWKNFEKSSKTICEKCCSKY